MRTLESILDTSTTSADNRLEEWWMKEFCDDMRIDGKYIRCFKPCKGLPKQSLTSYKEMSIDGWANIEGISGSRFPKVISITNNLAIITPSPEINDDNSWPLGTLYIDNITLDLKSSNLKLDAARFRFKNAKIKSNGGRLLISCRDIFDGRGLGGKVDYLHITTCETWIKSFCEYVNDDFNPFTYFGLKDLKVKHALTVRPIRANNNMPQHCIWTDNPNQHSTPTKSGYNSKLKMYWYIYY